MGPVAGVAIVVLVFDLTGLNCKVGSSGKKQIKFPLKLDLKWYLGLNCKVGSFAKKLIKFHLKLDLKWYFVTKTVLTYWERNVLRSLVQFLKQNAFLIISQKHQNNQNSNGKKIVFRNLQEKNIEKKLPVWQDEISFWSTGPQGHWLDKATQRLHKKLLDLRFWQPCINEIALKLKLIIYNFFVVSALCRALWSEFSIHVQKMRRNSFKSI